jgi:hypothetical protein
MGSARTQGTLLRNEHTLKSISYFYSSSVGSANHLGVVASKGMNLAFDADRLVAYEYLSTYSDDPTDFDESKVKEIVKGKTRKDEVISLLGSPTGRAIHPYVRPQDGEGMSYTYYQMRRSATPFRHEPYVYYKQLLVTLDRAGTVIEVEFTQTGEK